MSSTFFKNIISSTRLQILNRGKPNISTVFKAEVSQNKFCSQIVHRNYVTVSSRQDQWSGRRGGRDPVPSFTSPAAVDVNTMENDELCSSINSADTLQELLIVLEESESKSFTRKSIDDACRKLFVFIKGETSETVKHSILNSVGVQKLCKVLRYKAKYLEMEDLVGITKLFIFLNTPGSHLTFQLVLKLLSKSFNSMDLNRIVYVQFLLNKLGESKFPLAEALEVALPVVFESQLDVQLDPRDIQGQCDYLHYASQYDLSEKAIEKLVKALLTHNPEGFTPQQSLSILWALADMKNNLPYQEKLVVLAIKNISKNIEKYKLTEISTTLQKCCLKYLQQFRWFYQEGFVDAACNIFIRQNRNPKDTLYLFKFISLMRHINVDFMDHISEIISRDPELVARNGSLTANLVRGFGNSNYRPVKWDAMQNIINNPLFTTGSFSGDIGLASELLCVGTFPEALISRLFSVENIPKLEEYCTRVNNSISLTLIQNSIDLLYTDYRGPRLPESFVITLHKQGINKRRVFKNNPLRNHLISAFGGEAYVLDDIHHYGIHIDHAIVMRRGGYPIAIHGQKDKFTELNEIMACTVPDNVIVLMKVYFKEAYASNTSRLRGVHALEIRLLEKIGQPVVCVDASVWGALPDYEKIPYLMQQINLKIDQHQLNSQQCDNVLQ